MIKSRFLNRSLRRLIRSSRPIKSILLRKSKLS